MARHATPRATIILLIVTGLFFLSLPHPREAQSYSSPLESLFPIRTLEAYIGPIFPTGCLTSTFRSEVSTGFFAADLKGAKLIGSSSGELDLRNVSSLDTGPIKFDVAVDLRLWRFGLRGCYSNFETRSRHRNFGKVDFSGLNVGGDFDVVQLQWLSLGASLDGFLFHPEFRGVVRDVDSSLFNTVTLEVKGSRPWALGTYLRYVPPEILGFPMHVEAFYKFPVKGARYTTYGLSLVFRPQIYRFDVAAKMRAQITHLKFSTDPTTQYSPGIAAPPFQNWEVDMQWNMIGLDFSIYF
jgi:hypothetical protein